MYFTCFEGTHYLKKTVLINTRFFYQRIQLYIAPLDLISSLECMENCLFLYIYFLYIYICIDPVENQFTNVTTILHSYIVYIYILYFFQIQELSTATWRSSTCRAQRTRCFSLSVRSMAGCASEDASRTTLVSSG